MTAPPPPAGQTRVLAIVPAAFCFGLQFLTLSFFSQLSRRMDAHFLNTRWNDGEFPRRVAELGFAQSFTWLGMFSRRLDWRNLRMTLECAFRLPVAWWDFWRLYLRYRPHVIYFANYHELILLAPAMFMLRDRVVCHMHDPPPNIPFQRCTFFFWSRAVGRFLHISESVQARMVALGGAAVRGTVIHNGIQVGEGVPGGRRGNRFAADRGWPDEAVIVGISGQMTETKGHEDFIDAAAAAHAEAPSLRFVIGGRPTEPYRTRLEERIAAAGLAGVCQFVGWLPSARDFYHNIDVFVLASRHDEGFGLVVAEAMEAGCAVVATRSGGTVEIIEDGVSGWLVGKRAPAEMAKRLVALGANPLRRQGFSEAGRDRVVRRFNLRVQARIFEEFLIAAGTGAPDRVQ